MIEERGLGGVVELGGDVRQRIGVLGTHGTRRQRICERWGVAEHLRTTVLATSLGGRHTLAAGVDVGCRCAGPCCVQRVDLGGQGGLEGVERSPGSPTRRAATTVPPTSTRRPRTPPSQPAPRWGRPNEPWEHDIELCSIVIGTEISWRCSNASPGALSAAQAVCRRLAETRYGGSAVKSPRGTQSVAQLCFSRSLRADTQSSDRSARLGSSSALHRPLASAGGAVWSGTDPVRPPSASTPAAAGYAHCGTNWPPPSPTLLPTTRCSTEHSISGKSGAQAAPPVTPR